MDKLAVGILAHVDAGKTTLSEGMLYRRGAIRKLGRVDHRDAFLDTDALERERGITIFSKQAAFSLPTRHIALLDTPGHVDFSSEAERTLQVLDYAILVVSGTDGVQGHTQTLWRLLARYQVPTFLFVNKMDLPGPGKEALMEQLRRLLGSGCVDFSSPGEEWMEEAALCDEELMERYLSTGRVEDGDAAALVAGRQLFPCYFGSALRLEGVDQLLEGLERYTQIPRRREGFGAKVYKVSRDSQGARLTWLKVTGGTLRVKDLLSREGEAPWKEKVDQIRLYSGAKYQAVEEAGPGTVCAVPGRSRPPPGEGLGVEADSPLPVLEPVFAYQVILPEGCDPHTVLGKLRQLEEEDPQLHLVWNQALGEIHLQLMGEVQLEILVRLCRERFGLEISFGPGKVLYKETILEPVEGVGHFEPLRHYAEVHLILAPAPRGSGLRIATSCSEDQLDRNWQRLILTHLGEKEHLGVLTGSPITDMTITLAAGKAHLKHTEGGDFRQATYRAVRQGLRKAHSILLEPWYQFRLVLPADQVGRAMADIQQIGGRFSPPQLEGEEAQLLGNAPVAAMGNYQREVTIYTKGRGRLFCSLSGYEPCQHREEVIAAAGYDCQRDLDNPADSIFCDHGAGVVVPWDQVEGRMHLPSVLRPKEAELRPLEGPALRPREYKDAREEDRDLAAIYQRTYGEGSWQPPPPPRTQVRARTAELSFDPNEGGKDYLLVDGYNIIFAWDQLKELARDNLDAARQALMDILANYRGFVNCEVILVFDAYKVHRNAGEVARYHQIYVVYTREAETADMYIEQATYEIGKKNRVRVATSDGMEQLIILGHGALRLSARALWEEVCQVNGQIARIIEERRQSDRLGRRHVSLPLGKDPEDSNDQGGTNR